MRVLLKMYSPCPAKLGFCKAVKDLTALGLKEAKDFIDSMCEEQGVRGSAMREIYLTGSYADNKHRIKEFRDALSMVAPNAFQVNDTEHERNRKLLSLGVASEGDYLDGIAEVLTQLCYNKNVDEMCSEIRNAFKCIEQAKLEEIYSQLSKRLSDDDGENTYCEV